MNESFNSTTLKDALFVGTEVMRRILDLGVLGVYVTSWTSSRRSTRRP